ncbi:hypothetical protein D3C77_533350 [compost metagenome]
MENEGLLLTKQGTGTFVAQVGQSERGEYRRMVVQEAVEAAVDAGLSVQYSEEELKALFLQIIKDKYRTEDGEGI